MKKNTVLLLAVFTALNISLAQVQSTPTKLSFYAGIQKPVSELILDLDRQGAFNYFDSGMTIGFGVRRETKRIAMSLRGTYSRNQLKKFLDVEQNSNLQSVSSRGDFWINVLKPHSRFRLEIGTGLGVIYIRHPGYQINREQDKYGSHQRYTDGPVNTLTFSINSGINLSYSINNHYEIFTAFGNDLIMAYYGDEESDTLRSLTCGFRYQL